MLKTSGRSGARPRLKQLLGRDAELRGVARELLDDPIRRKHVMPGADGRMRREHRRCGNRLERRLELQSARRVFAQPLEHRERGVALVDVPDGRRETERAQHAHACRRRARPLAAAAAPRRPVQRRGDLAVVRRVLGHVGIEEQHRERGRRRLARRARRSFDRASGKSLAAPGRRRSGPAPAERCADRSARTRGSAGRAGRCAA